MFQKFYFKMKYIIHTLISFILKVLSQITRLTFVSQKIKKKIPTLYSFEAHRLRLNFVDFSRTEYNKYVCIVIVSSGPKWHGIHRSFHKRSRWKGFIFTKILLSFHKSSFRHITLPFFNNTRPPPLQQPISLFAQSS